MADKFDGERKATLLSSFMERFEEYKKKLEVEEAETISGRPSVPSREEKAEKIEETENEGTPKKEL